MILLFDGDRIYIEQYYPGKLLVTFAEETLNPRNSVVFKSAHFGDLRLQPSEEAVTSSRFGHWQAFNIFPPPSEPSWSTLGDSPNDDDDPDDPENIFMRWDFVITDGLRTRTLSFHLEHGAETHCTLYVDGLTLDLDLGAEFWNANFDRCMTPRSEQEKLRFAPRMEAPPEVQSPSLWDRLSDDESLTRT